MAISQWTAALYLPAPSSHSSVATEVGNSTHHADSCEIATIAGSAIWLRKAWAWASTSWSNVSGCEANGDRNSNSARLHSVITSSRPSILTDNNSGCAGSSKGPAMRPKTGWRRVHLMALRNHLAERFAR